MIRNVGSKKSRTPRPPVGLRASELRVGDETLVVLSYPAPIVRRAGDAWTLLTPSEREVLLLVLQGQLSAEIAASRGCALATVNKQIETAYRKLGVSSRAELAARFGDRAS
jgi:DNA-binding CsgD family transcriptional regulator